MILKNRLKRLERRIKERHAQDWMSEDEQIALFGKTIKQMTNKELKELLSHFLDLEAVKTPNL